MHGGLFAAPINRGRRTDKRISATASMQVCSSVLPHSLQAYNSGTMAMTPEEHSLMLMMFTRLSQHIASIEEILKSREIVKAEDLPAFDYAVRTDFRATAVTFHGMAEQYRRFAGEVGIQLPRTFGQF